MDVPSRTPPEAKLNSGSPVGWQLDHHDLEELLLKTGAAVLPKASELLQNCDLPPPVKVFPAIPKGVRDGGTCTGTALPSSPPKRLSLRKTELHGADGTELDRGGDGQGPLLEALRLSQTRAREAEKEAAALREKTKLMASLLIEESLTLYAHRQWLRLLEVENAWLRREKSTWRKGGAGVGPPSPEGCVVVAICLGIAGLGLVIGCRLLW